MFCSAMSCSASSAKLQLRFIKHGRCVLILLGYLSISIGNLSAQNSSLFHKPVVHLAQGGNPAGSGEILPAPLAQRGVVQPNSEFTPQPRPNFVQPPNMNPFQGGYFPSPMDSAGQLGLQTSWSYVPPAPARSLKLHDIVSIRIEETSTSLATGNATSRKTTSYDASVREWIRLVGLDTIKPAPQADGNPRVQTEQTEVYRGDSTIRTSEAFTRNIAAEIVDIKPNGLIVLDATKVIEENDNSWRYSLTGTCRSQDIDPNNVVLSRNLIQSHMKKQDLGHVRDGYSRGWLTKLLARIKPF